MINKDKVQRRYPYACAEAENSPGEWCIWDISRERQRQLDLKHFPERHGRGLYGVGETEAKAWADAVRTIEQMEGRKL